MNLYPSDPRLPEPGITLFRPLYIRLYELFRQYSNIGNTAAMWDTAGTVAPTTGTWAQGDKCRNTAPSESGTAGSKTVTIGWICTASGTPGTWLDMRVTTGN